MLLREGDLADYVRDRMHRDPEFAQGFEEGYAEFRATADPTRGEACAELELIAKRQGPCET